MAQGTQTDTATATPTDTTHTPRHAEPITVLRRSQTATAIPWTGDNLRQVQAFCWPQSPMTHGETDLAVQVLDQVSMAKWPSLGRQMTIVFVERGGWIVRADGELSVWTAATFAAQWVADLPETPGARVATSTSLDRPDPRD